MVKNKKAFSLVDALIILVGLAIVIVISTPVITKKSVNIADIGASLSGAAHGRVEAYRKEIIKFDGYDKWLEKTSIPSASFFFFIWMFGVDFITSPFPFFLIETAPFGIS